MKLRFVLFSALAAAFSIVHAEDKPKADSKDMTKPEIVKSDEDWKKLLTLEQFEVTRQRGTERPFGHIYEEFEKQGEGTYYCVCCGAELFTSKEKFHSGCGWPSFYDSSKAKGVLEKVDDSHGMHRVETVCKRCGAHLGHVFEGEGFKTPTNRRFCINGVALKFVPKGGEAPKLLEVNSEAVQNKKDEVAKEGGVEPKK
ncbi:peptide-methionine (R)-S-oxide reductase MsrB [Prosthecobacter sp.]|uniref:peptide-methionine (R)-S-oxide reductase MsrB n=1 Tax=Prosthecobacter sp. TaxID=1965333 RepID=UPI001DEBE901|nr:peptide-methionine (R)-S-oxide reductase MsrB [Prosthecobacter sp.]MCB1277259.1 peptide-methionine (R)-S-oxide reductase MsrB [Prosthecobacter sp.]